MFIGEFNHTIDDKNRLALPAKFRKALGKKLIITHGLDTCLFIYAQSEWNTFAEKLGTLSMGQADTRAFARFLLGGATEVAIDNNGRILIPDFLKKFAKFATKVVAVGVGTRIELWSESSWKRYKTVLDKNADEVAEKLGEIGMI